MSVRRYDVNGPSSVFEDVNGSLVDFKDYAELESKCAALAAENAGLNKYITQSCYVFDGEQHEISDAYICATDGAMPEIPDTDAFLAEVLASAVDEVCLKISNAIVNCYQDELVGLDMAATICGDFASQLRKGVQS
ncbi:hypothetical protein [Citrobacter amalonaticus]|uniref:hypothetical protein n=1 Tax=Citrobacter amalonaticus TaxID=35703 RepID=UPI0036F3AA7A